MSQLLVSTLLAGLLLLTGAAASARPCPVLPDEANQAMTPAELDPQLDEQPIATAIRNSEVQEPRTRIVARVSRFCRRGICFRLIEYREVLEAVEEIGYRAPTIARPAAPAAPTCGTAEETEALRLANEHRARLGLGTLSCDLTALKVARAHSLDMCTRSYFSHDNPEGAAPWDRLRQGGARFSSAGENIAMGYDTPETVHNGWLDSPGHRQNIERRGWTRAAVGVVHCEGGKYWTQLFAR